jgi:hypothetical protein
MVKTLAKLVIVEQSINTFANMMTTTEGNTTDNKNK